MIECRGGPLDGDRVADSGVFFLVLARVIEGRGWSGGDGIYVRTGQVYRWQPAGDEPGIGDQ